MLNKPEKMRIEIREKMRGGSGHAKLIHLAEGVPNMRLCALIELEQGCSIGEHEHHNESEVYYIISGSALVTDCDRQYYVHPGDMAITLDNEYHSITNPFEEKLVMLAAVIHN